MSKVAPNIISFSGAISACEKSGRWEAVLDLLSVMHAARIQGDTISFSAAISSCQKAGEWRMALPPGSVYSCLMKRFRAGSVKLRTRVQGLSSFQGLCSSLSLWFPILPTSQHDMNFGSGGVVEPPIRFMGIIAK